MNTNFLDHIEKSGKPVNFNYSILRKMLWQDPETGKYPHLYSFYLDNKDLGIFPVGVSEEDMLITLRVELREKLQEIDDVIYFKRLEDSLNTQVEMKLGETSAEFRQEISTLIGEISVLDDEKVAQIRDADKVDILEGDLKLDTKVIQDYIKLVRAEVGLQLVKLGELEGDKLSGSEKDQKTRDVYEKVGYLFSFLAENIPDDDGAKKAYLKAFLMRQMRSKKGFSVIRKWYEELRGHLSGANMADCRESIQAMVGRLQREASAHRGNHLKEIISIHAPDIKISDRDISDILRKDAAGNDMVTVRGDSTYVQKIGYHLEEIEMTAFQLGVEETMVDLDPSVLSDRRSSIVKEIQGLRRDLEEFQDQKYNVENLIETKFKRLPFSKRAKLKAAADSVALVTEHREQVRPHQKAFMARLQAVDADKNMPAAVDEILADSETDVVAYLVKQGFKVDHLNRLKTQDPNFDVYQLLREQIRSDQLREDQGQEAPPTFSGSNLSDIVAQFASVDRFDSADDMVTVISAIHYTKGLTTDSVNQIIRVIDASNFSDAEREFIYTKFANLLLRSTAPGIADLSESFRIANAQRIKHPQVSDLELSHDFESTSKAQNPHVFPTAMTPSDLAISQVFEWADDVPPAEEESEDDDDGRQKSTLESSLDFETGQLKRSVLEDEKFYGQALTQDEVKDLDTQEYLAGEPLNQMRVEMYTMEQICRRNFSRANDLAEFDRIKEKMQKISEVYYKTEEAVMDENGKSLFYNGEQVKMMVKALKKLPYVEESRLQSMLLQRDHKRVFEKSQQKLAELGELEMDDGKIRAALSTLYSEMYECGNETQVNKLTKMMTVDHPLTCIRFNAAKKQPFMSSDEKFYQMVDVNGRPTIVGKPATYKQRAQELLKEAKRLMKDGNFAQLRKLFSQGEKGDRLYMDSAFFPVHLLKGKSAQRTALLYETGVDDEGNVIPTRPSEKIPSVHHELFSLKDEASRKRDDEICNDRELNQLPDCLADDPEFATAMKMDKETQEIINQFQEALVLDEQTGETYVDEEKFREIMRAGKKVMGAGGDGADDEEAIKLSKARLDEIAKDNPLAAARAAQYNSEMLGKGLAGLQLAGRKMVDLMKLGPMLANRVGQDYWKGMLFYSPMSLYFAFEQGFEHIAALADFRVKFKSYWLMANMFKGTIIGSEFEKLMQGKENERVDDFKKAFDQYGNQDVLDKMTGARDRFEFKQTLIQVFQERGLVTNEDLCTIKFLKTLNKFNPNYSIRINWTDGEMANDDEIQREVLDEIKKSIDKFWGGGQFISWKNAGVQKYEGWRKQSFDNFSQYGGGPIRAKIYEKYWNWISNDREKLTSMHPGELVGNIENDMVVGHLNSGQSFAIFQALLCEGIIKYEHLKRLELTDHHINNLPFFTFLEPKEAELAGLTEIYKQCKGLPYDADKNPFVGFYEGKTALKLKAHRHEGKWFFAKSQKDFDALEQKGANKEVVMTAHQLQRRREAQPEWFKKMDNACIGLFIPSYNWGQIEAGLNMDNNGEINGARPHDICAGYRGMQWEFTSYLESMSDKEKYPELNDVTKFKQQIHFAYEALSKNGALAGYFARQKGRKNDWSFNPDGSPNFDHRVTEDRAKSGKSNMERQILDISGHHQRLSESATTLDGMKAFEEDPSNGTITYDMRKAFKKMSGHQHLRSIGMDPVTGKKNPAGYKAYEIMSFDPSGTYRDEAIPAFVENVLKLAAKRGIGKEIRESLGVDSYGAGGVFGNFDKGNVHRDHLINEWKINEAQML
jgi:hypothetical protein